MSRATQRFVRDARAIALVEFALVLPIILVVALTGFDLTRYIYATYRVGIIANSVAQFLSVYPKSAAAQTPGDGVVGDWDINFAWNSAYFLYPELLTSPLMAGNIGNGNGYWPNIMQVNISAVKMTPNGSGYNAVVAWTSNTGIQRTCGSTLAVVANWSAVSPTTIPSGMIGPNNVMVVDVHYTFTPIVSLGPITNITITRTVFISPRYVPYIEYSGTGWMATSC